MNTHTYKNLLADTHTKWEKERESQADICVRTNAHKTVQSMLNADRLADALKHQTKPKGREKERKKRKVVIAAAKAKARRPSTQHMRKFISSPLVSSISFERDSNPSQTENVHSDDYCYKLKSKPFVCQSSKRKQRNGVVWIRIKRQ